MQKRTSGSKLQKYPSRVRPALTLHGLQALQLLPQPLQRRRALGGGARRGLCALARRAARCLGRRQGLLGARNRHSGALQGIPASSQGPLISLFLGPGAGDELCLNRAVRRLQLLQQAGGRAERRAGDG